MSTDRPRFGESSKSTVSFITGIRMDIVRNLSVRDIWYATETVSKCPHCSLLVTWSEHKHLCPSRKEKANCNILDLDEERKYLPSTPHYTVKVSK